MAAAAADQCLDGAGNTGTAAGVAVGPTTAAAAVAAAAILRASSLAAAALHKRDEDGHGHGALIFYFGVVWVFCNLCGKLGD